MGCSYCTNRKALAGFNDLAFYSPRIAKYVDGWSAESIVFGSPKEMKWKCELDHKWVARVDWMVNLEEKTNPCPYCGKRKLLKDVNDLATTHPELAAESYLWDPTEVMGNSSTFYDWKCPEGHIYSARVIKRVSRGDNCSVCSGHRRSPLHNSLLALKPDIAAEAHRWDPSLISIHTNEIKEWKCGKEGHIYHSGVASRVRSTSPISCPVCRGTQLFTTYNDLATLRPDIAKEAVGWDAKEVTVKDTVKRLWQCELNHQWKATPNARAQHDTGCPYCAGKKVWAGYNDLKTLFPNLVEEVYGWDPATIRPGTHQRLSWKCVICEHIWKATPNSRTTNGQGCPECSISGFSSVKPGVLYLNAIFMDSDISEPVAWKIGITNKDPQKRAYEQSRKLADGYSLRPSPGVLECRTPGEGSRDQDTPLVAPRLRIASVLQQIRYARWVLRDSLCRCRFFYGAERNNGQCSQQQLTEGGEVTSNVTSPPFKLARL